MAFFELNIGVSGLFASQRGLQVTSNNITNATTKGYSRQELKQQASTPLTGIGVGMVGTGVTTTGITRIRDSYLDNKLWTQNAKLGEYNIKVTQNSLVESVYGEPSDSGFTAVFNDMFKAMSSLSLEPSSEEAQIVLREEMISFTKYYNTIASSLKQYQKDLNIDIKATVQEINTLAQRIQSLNKQIFESEIYGDDANNFRDERDLCIDRLSQIINVEATEYQTEVNGNPVTYFKVKVAGQTLVDHTNVNTLEIKVRGQEEERINASVAELEKLYAKLKITTAATEKDEIKAQIETIHEGLKALTRDISIDDEGNITYTKDNQIIEVLKVDADFNTKVQSAGDGKNNVVDADGLYEIVWASGINFDMGNATLSGELKGLIDMRDGCGTGADVTYNGIPYYMKRMNEYVRQFAKTMNETYSKSAEGYIEVDPVTIGGKAISFIEKDKNGNIIACYDADKKAVTLTDDQVKELAKSYTTKYKLFSYATGDTTGVPTDGDDILGDDYSKLTAENFSISEELYDDITNMRTTYDESNPSDTSFLLTLVSQKDNKDMFKEGDPKDYMISIFSDLGISAKESKMYQSTQTSVTNNIINQRLSVSQVDTSEEFAYLIKYQQAYQASAKIINTIDGIYETTIFKLGNF